MFGILLVVLVVVLLLGRPPGWSPADPVGLLVTVLLIVVLLALLTNAFGVLRG